MDIIQVFISSSNSRYCINLYIVLHKSLWYDTQPLKAPVNSCGITIKRAMWAGSMEVKIPSCIRMLLEAFNSRYNMRLFVLHLAGQTREWQRIFRHVQSLSYLHMNTPWAHMVWGKQFLRRQGITHLLSQAVYIHSVVAKELAHVMQTLDSGMTRAWCCT